MERFAFIHGSSVGQSTFLPKDAPSSICNDIADKYFKGRIPRQKESYTEKALFVDLYKSTNGELYCVYSFVNNYCRGANEREGQYFALSILSKGVYLYPEDIYRMLSAAYEQMFNTNKILGLANGEVQYRISQFSEQEEYLSAFLERVITILDNKIGNLGKVMEGKYRTADYDSWHGVKTSLDVCNSLASYNDLYEIGRLYISDSYESPSVKNKSLEDDIKKLKKDRADLEERIAKMMKTADSKARDEIAKLREEIKAQEAEIQSSKSQLDEYEDTIDIVRKQLDKYAKLGKKISDAQETRSKYEVKGKKDIVHTILLVIIMLLTLALGVMNFCFFRNFSPSPKEETKGEITQKVTPAQETQPQANQTPSPSVDIATETIKTASFLTVVPESITTDAKERQETIVITTDGVWEMPKVPQSAKEWISFSQINEKELRININENTGQAERRSVFTIKSGTVEKQVTVVQKGKIMPVATEVCPEYGIVVTDELGNSLDQTSVVPIGQIVIATVTNPEFKEGYGWTSWNCEPVSPNEKKNLKSKRFKVTGTNNASKNTFVIGYGNLNNSNLREKCELKLRRDPIQEYETPVAPEKTDVGNGGFANEAVSSN